jgi:hypothetical protein
MGLTREEKDVIPDANHMEMARFSSRNDAGYKIVEDAIRHCIDAAAKDSASQTAVDAPGYPDADCKLRQPVQYVMSFILLQAMNSYMSLLRTRSI